jgi:RNA polymerase sigma-70 factor (ECF subfamily)
VERAEDNLLPFPGHSEPADASMDADVLEDARLLASVASGCDESLAVLYGRRGGLLYSLILRVVVSEGEAQEVMQDSFVQIWRQAPTYDPRRSPALAWMVMIARGLAIDKLRARTRRGAVHEAYERDLASLAVEPHAGPSHAERGELAKACAVALRNLPEQQGRPLQLAFFRGWTHEEIARAEGQPLGTIKARVRRGLLALRHSLKDYHA